VGGVLAIFIIQQGNPLFLSMYIEIIFDSAVFLFQFSYNSIKTMNINDLIQRLIKYLVVGLAVAVCAVLIPKKSPAVEEVTALALAAACTMAIVDTFTNPVIAHSLNQGLGFGLGANLVGFPRL
jgi:ABC-type thiamin/hydroxymethylpyrimidine transport system permease subunit